MMHKSRRLKITDLNPHLTCVLCSGYLIDATTIIECLHSFCRCCIVKYLECNKYCPICDVQVHKTKPLLNIRSDQTLQDIVYKLVPGLFQNEMCRRRDFYTQHPDHKPTSAESNGEVTQVSHIYTADENISLSLEYYNNNISSSDDADKQNKQAHANRRYLRCPAAVSVLHLQKLIRAKYGLSIEHRIDIMYMNERLNEDFTLMDIAYIYLWRRKGPLHLTYRIFEVVKKLKKNENSDKSCTNITANQLESNDNNTWKEVQLQISENGVMSVTNIEETKPEILNPIEVKNETTETKDEISEKSAIEKSSEIVVKEENDKSVLNCEQEKNTVLGKHKLTDVSDVDETSVKLLKRTIPTTNAVKNIQQLSRNHPLKIHSQSVKSSVTKVPAQSENASENNAQDVIQTNSSEKSHNIEQTINNNNNTDKSVINTKAEITIEKIDDLQMVQNQDKIKPDNSFDSNENLNKTKILVSTSDNSSAAIKSETQIPVENSMQPSTQKCSSEIVITHSEDLSITSKSSVSQSTTNDTSMPVNCIQTSKVSILSKKSPVKVSTPVGYKTLRDPPKTWNPQISRQNLVRMNAFNSNPSTSDQSKVETKISLKPPKFFKMRNMPRYLGNPASGVKPMYQVHEGDKNSNLKNEHGKPQEKETKDESKQQQKNSAPNSLTDSHKDKFDLPKPQGIVKIDPKTLRPIAEKPQTVLNNSEEIKINQSTVSIFNPLRTQKSQTSPKFDRRSPKISYMDIQSGSKSTLERNSPKIISKISQSSGKCLNSPTSKKEKPSLNFTPPNPFIPNLASPNLAPNHFLYSSFPTYDPRVVNNVPIFHNLPISLSMLYSQSGLNFPGLTGQNLPLSPNLSLNLEINKNLRVNKNYDISPATLSSTFDMKRALPAKKLESPRDSYNGSKCKVEKIALTDSRTEKIEDVSKTVENKMGKDIPAAQDKVDSNKDMKLKEEKIQNHEEKLKIDKKEVKDISNAKISDSDKKTNESANEKLLTNEVKSEENKT